MVALSHIKIAQNPFGKTEIYSKDEEVKIEYIGTLEDNKAGRINQLKESCYAILQEKYPWWKQTDAAMTIALHILDLIGVIQGNLTEIDKSHSPVDVQEAIETCKIIKAHIDLCNQYEAQIINAKNLDVVWSINFVFDI